MTLGTITTGVWHGTVIGAAYLPSLDAITAPAADMSFNTHKAKHLLDPTNPQDAATMVWVQNQFNILDQAVGSLGN